MKLGKCPECRRIINIDELEEVADDEVIGCGFAENNMEFCDNCACEHGSPECERARSEEKLSFTTVKEYRK